LKNSIALLLLIFSTLSFAKDNDFEDIATSPEVILPVGIGATVFTVALPFAYAEEMAMKGKIFSVVGALTIVAGFTAGGIMYALDN